jgi:hypothetical protein
VTGGVQCKLEGPGVNAEPFSGPAAPPTDFARKRGEGHLARAPRLR